MYSARGAVVSKITSGWPEKRAKIKPPAACAMIVFWTVIAPPVVLSFKLPKATEGSKQAKNKKTVAEIDFEIDFSQVSKKLFENFGDNNKTLVLIR